MFIQAFCPQSMQPEHPVVKTVAHSIINTIISLALHTLAAYLLGINPVYGLAMGGFVQLVHLPVLCCTGTCGGFGGGCIGGLLGASIGACVEEPAKGAQTGAIVGGGIVAIAAIIGSVFLTYYIAMHICNAIPSLGTTLTYGGTLAILGVSFGLSLSLGLIEIVAILSRNSLEGISESLKNEPGLAMGISLLKSAGMLN